MSAPEVIQRTSIQLYRDCIRLIRHIAPGNSPKGATLKAMVRTEFNKSAGVTDEAKIEVLKAGAIRALSNYMLYESGAKDEKLRGAMNRFNKSTLGDKSVGRRSRKGSGEDDKSS